MSVPRGAAQSVERCGYLCLNHHRARVTDAVASTAPRTSVKHGSRAVVTVLDVSGVRSSRPSGVRSCVVSHGAASVSRKASTPWPPSSITSSRWVKTDQNRMPTGSRSASRTAMRRPARSLDAARIVVAPSASWWAAGPSLTPSGGRSNRWKSNTSETALESTTREVVFKKSLIRNRHGFELSS